MNNKRLFTPRFCIICACIAILFCLMAVFFHNRTDTSAASGYWSANYEAFNTSTKVDGNKVVDGNTINIYKAEHLAYVAWYVNNGKSTPFRAGFQGYTIELKTGINLTAHYWTPIGSYTSDTSNNPLIASFNGNNCLIIGLTFGDTYPGQFLSFIGYTTNDVSNICISGVTFPTYLSNNASCVVGMTTGNISHCQVYNNKTSTIYCRGSSAQKIGGICSCFYGTKIAYCNSIFPLSINDASGYSPLTIAGGICAYVNNGEITKCINQASISSYCKYGISAGICMIVSGKINNCENAGDIKSNRLYGFGIAYSSSSAEIKNCSNFGKVQSPEGSFGICYDANQVDYCYNKGEIIAAGTYDLSQNEINYLNTLGIPNHAGQTITTNCSGICNNVTKSVKNCINVGNISTSVANTHMCGIVNKCPTIVSCKNSGNIETFSGCSGIALIASGNPFYVEYCENSGNIKSSSRNGASGVFQYNEYLYSLNVKNCVNRGDISGSSAGGISDSLFHSGSLTTSNCIIQNCANYGNVTASGINAAGIIGAAIYMTIKNCFNAGTIKNTYDTDDRTMSAAGILGSLDRGSECIIVGCINYGSISARRNVGGIVGYAYNENNKIYGCCNYGTITSNGTKDYYQGGVIGRAKSNDPTAQYNANYGDCKTSKLQNKSNFGTSNGKGIDNATVNIKNNLNKHGLSDVLTFLTKTEGYAYLKNNYSIYYTVIGNYVCIGSSIFSSSIFNQYSMSKYYSYSLKENYIFNKTNANMDNNFHIQFIYNECNFIAGTDNYKVFAECYWKYNYSIPDIS